MAIFFDKDNNLFHLRAKDTSYVLRILEPGYLAHVYWGRKVRSSNLDYTIPFVNRAFSTWTDNIENFSLDAIPQEYPSYGNTDLRSPAYQIQLENGSTITNLKYESYNIYKGKKKLEGLPATYVESENEAETLEIILKDNIIGLKVLLSYTVFENYDAITRSVKLINEGSEKLKILRALSANVDFRDDEFDMIQLCGAHVRERNIIRKPITVGSQSIESKRGASSHQANPFIALLRKNADEDNGEVFGFSLVYSGNFLANVEVDQYKTTRVHIGINPFDFSYILRPLESFQTPEVVMVYSDSGLGKLSRTYHKLYRTRLARGKYRDKERPVLINNWEATYFNFNENKIKEIASTAKELGIELLVLDDGWFGKRDTDKNSLGDWVVNREKLPGGINSIAENLNSQGMGFGLWFEPEMISPDSDLYRKHPDWCMHVPNRNRSESRYQLILDLSRNEVCDEVIKMVSDILSSAAISYVKWDMNRNMSEIGSAVLPSENQRETAHRYILGLYKIMEQITSSFPDILFESCSGGGGRFDPGFLYYMPQTWTSDNTDAVERLKIQYGTSLVYPIISMGSHVSAVPNHQVYRNTSLETRGHVAMSGNLGYELDVTKMSEKEKVAVKKQVDFYKEIRNTIQFGDFYRLKSPFESNETAWMFISEDGGEVIVYYFRVLAEANVDYKPLRLKGLDKNSEYKVTNKDRAFGGDELMFIGLNIPSLQGDFQSYIWKFKKI
ncbi:MULTISPECIES: alpha-galactosidase [Clostridium]|uniref:Alpha-galactosidase n=1 Tax=Clostridium frigoriphilum TaxID=443253 RepID=A0ABU7UNY8_9CLOT|nr:alpha-galactosidase [Clostridium sp. DSM 17811]MBU3099904.1 alpha-galactosidase [Clostridium sp. DSM 17811]